MESDALWLLNTTMAGSVHAGILLADCLAALRGLVSVALHAEKPWPVQGSDHY